MLTRKMLRASAVVSLAGAAMFTPPDQAFAVRGGDGGGGGERARHRTLRY